MCHKDASTTLSTAALAVVDFWQLQEVSKVLSQGPPGVPHIAVAQEENIIIINIVKMYHIHFGSVSIDTRHHFQLTSCIVDGIYALGPCSVALVNVTDAKL